MRLKAPAKIGRRSRRGFRKNRRAPFSSTVSTWREARRIPRRRSSTKPMPWLVIAARTSGASATRSTSFWASSLSRTLSHTRLAVSLLSNRSVAFAAVSLSSARSTPRSAARSRPSRRASPCAPLTPARAMGAVARCSGLDGGRSEAIVGPDPPASLGLGGKPGETNAPAALRAGDEAAVRVDVALGGAGIAVHAAGPLRADRGLGVVDGVAGLAVRIPGLRHRHRGGAVQAGVLEVLVGVGNGAACRAPSGRRGRLPLARGGRRAGGGRGGAQRRGHCGDRGGCGARGVAARV